MRFMTLVSGPPVKMEDVPPIMFELVEKWAADEEKNGVLLTRGGFLPADKWFSLTAKDGQVVVTDGPYTETKEIVGGWSILSYPTREDAIAGAKKFVELNVKHWPGWKGTVEVRPCWE